MTRRWFSVVALVALAVSGMARIAAQENTPWVHIRVDETGEEAKKVRINLPLSVVELAMEAAPDDVIERGSLKLQAADVSVEELRRLWQELRASGDAEFVSVEKEDQRVRIAREGSYVHIQVTDLEEGESKVRVQVPVHVVDALLEGEGPELNLRAAIRRLRSERGELIRVDEGEKQVRIWIDERKSTE